jgi:hypothetical protein
MTSDRPYRGALSVAEATDRLRTGAGKQWDPVVVDALLHLVAGGHPSFLAASMPPEMPFDGPDDHDHRPPTPGDRPIERDAA